MSPSSLRAMASNVDARVGIEFEMYVPNVKDLDGNGDSEDEWIDADDQRVGDIDDVVDFFYNGGDSGASRSDRERFREDLISKFNEWNEKQKEQEWISNGEEYLKDYILDDIIEDDAVVEKMKEKGNWSPIAESLFDRYISNDLRRMYGNRTLAASHLTQEELDTLTEMVPVFLEIRGELADEMSEESWSSEDEHYDAAKEKYIAEEADEGEERHFFDAEYGREASDFTRIAHRHDMYWPQVHNENYSDRGDPDEIDESDVENVADEFERITGFDTTHGGDYHSTKRDGQRWVVEPDSSLDSRQQDDDHGLEFVSPPLTLSEMYDALEKVKAYTKKKGCYADESCGLHINVSVPNMEKLDAFKLLVFLGDQHVLAEYGRELVHYCQSAYKKVTNNAKKLSAEALNDFLSSTEYRATLKLTHPIVIDLMSGVVGEKYVSTNLHRMEGPDKVTYIEFRSPGGDWINGDVSTKIVDTINRFVVALDIACDPERYKQEYAKKLYKAMARSSDDVLAELMAKKVAGTLSNTEIVKGLKKLEQERYKNGTGKRPALFQVFSSTMDDSGRTPYLLYVVATTHAEALQLAYKEWKLGECGITLPNAVLQLGLQIELVNSKPSAPIQTITRPEMEMIWYVVRDTTYMNKPTLVKAYTKTEAMYRAHATKLSDVDITKLSAFIAPKVPTWWVYFKQDYAQNFTRVANDKNTAIQGVTRGYHLASDQLDAILISAPD